METSALRMRLALVAVQQTRHKSSNVELLAKQYAAILPKKAPSGINNLVLYKKGVVVYERLFNMDEVRQAHKRVASIQEQLQTAEQTRRDVLFEVLQVEKEIQNNRSDFVECDKSSFRYVELTKQRVTLEQKQKSVMEHFKIVEAEERALFVQLMTAIQSCHKNEKLQSEQFKYWSLLGTIFGTFLSLVGTLVGYTYGNRRNSVFEASNKINHNLASFESKMTASIGQLTDQLKKITSQQANANESWGNYLWRKSAGAYRYFIPKS